MDTLIQSMVPSWAREFLNCNSVNNVNITVLNEKNPKSSPQRIEMPGTVPSGTDSTTGWPSDALLFPPTWGAGPRASDAPEPRITLVKRESDRSLDHLTD